jgi:hypothetical protein
MSCCDDRVKGDWMLLLERVGCGLVPMNRNWFLSFVDWEAQGQLVLKPIGSMVKLGYYELGAAYTLE